jgi:hypothetical protein
MCSEVMGDEISSGRPKNAFVFDFLFAFGRITGRLVGDTGWFSATAACAHGGAGGAPAPAPSPAPHAIP